MSDHPEIQPTIVDARGLRCPEPVLKARLAMQDLKAGERIELWCTDPHAEIDVDVFCHRTRHRLLQLIHEDEGVLKFLIEHRPDQD